MGYRIVLFMWSYV